MPERRVFPTLLLGTACALSVAMRADIPVPLRPLQRQEIVEKLDAIPVFSVINRQTQQVVPTASKNGVLRCDFHLELAEATASLEMLRRGNPGVLLTLAATPLGTAFALSEWEQVDVDPNDDDSAPKVELRLQACQAEALVVAPLLSEAPVPPLLRRRNEVNGALPLFGSNELRFAAEQGKPALPLFFRRNDFVAAWMASGGKAEAMPVVQVTDLRTLAWQMQFDCVHDWRPLLFVAPAPWRPEAPGPA